jgi:rhodanese-related sulfurtransferase
MVSVFRNRVLAILGYNRYLKNECSVIYNRIACYVFIIKDLIAVDNIRERLEVIPRDRVVLFSCQVVICSYIVSRILSKNGFAVITSLVVISPIKLIKQKNDPYPV